MCTGRPSAVLQMLSIFGAQNFFLGIKKVDGGLLALREQEIMRGREVRVEAEIE